MPEHDLYISKSSHLKQLIYQGGNMRLSWKVITCPIIAIMVRLIMECYDMSHHHHNGKIVLRRTLWGIFFLFLDNYHISWFSKIFLTTMYLDNQMISWKLSYLSMYKTSRQVFFSFIVEQSQRLGQQHMVKRFHWLSAVESGIRWRSQIFRRVS